MFVVALLLVLPNFIGYVERSNAFSPSFLCCLDSQTSVDRSQPGDDRGSQEFDREETGPDPDAAQATGMSTGQPTGGPVETGDVPVSSAAKPVQVADRPVKMTTAGPIDPQPSTSTAGQEPVIMPPG